MKIAVTGGSGFLGLYVANAISENNKEPVVFTRHKQNINEINYEHRVTNYTIPDLVEKLSDIDAIVHLAARRGGQGLISDFHDNEVLTQNLYEACLKLNISNIVYASTISVYSDESLLPWFEYQLPNPYLMYGVSKLACEHIGNIYSKKGLKVKNLRLAHLYGFNEKNNYMINRFFRQAFHRETLILNGDSIAKREFLYCKDAAKGIICALKQHDISGTFNIGSGDYLSNLEVANIINRKFDNIGNLETREGQENIKSSYMDSSKAKAQLNYLPNYDFSSAVLEIYKLMRGLDYVPLWY